MPADASVPGHPPGPLRLGQREAVSEKKRLWIHTCTCFPPLGSDLANVIDVVVPGMRA